MVKGLLEDTLTEVLTSLGAENTAGSIEFSDDSTHGDYATGIALSISKKLDKNPKELAEEVKQKLIEKNLPFIFKIEVAGPGFINFFLKRNVFSENLGTINADYGKNSILFGKKTIVEYTDPNPFKEFHIGHLMSNAVGESISRLVEFSGAKTKHACYQGDIGLHVACALWGALNGETDWGKAYAKGATTLKENEVIKQEIIEINKKVYEKSDTAINKLYEKGKKKSLEKFEKMYQKLGTKFDEYFFESETGEFGKKVVLENLEKRVFEKGNGGAVVYKGEKFGLHTRVFINSQGLPTYEAKELGLAKIKYDKFPYDLSIVVTGNEIDAYFKVLLSAMKEIFSELAEKTLHISHGMLRLPSGKMSSRTGDVVTAEGLLAQISEKLLEKIPAENTQLLNDVSVAAIKYSVLKQEIGKDIIFDFDKSISFSGDSGPYLQYTHARCVSLLEKGKAKNIEISKENPIKETLPIERLLMQFPEVVERAVREYRPHHVATYLHNLASIFNTFYNDVPIVKAGDPSSAYKLFVVNALRQTLANGLYLLGIKAPEKM